MRDKSKHIKCEEKQEQQKEFVIAVPYTIVDECAVMVEPLDTLVAIVAMSGLLRPQIFTLDAYIIKMKRFIQHSF